MLLLDSWGGGQVGAICRNWSEVESDPHSGLVRSPLEKVETGSGGTGSSCTDRVASHGVPGQAVSAVSVSGMTRGCLGEKAHVRGSSSAPPVPTFGQVLVRS